ncbi:putative DsbA family dithiol-disulfide isomerase [Deinobacterium chartae]|uniref:Putative DsbA family dithiol-disulfide isomerase n=1 Tax=Deinobacterium chartae TaxID=521158 RepID=A0A841HVI8_9DEIO|nr:DsbA family oxidoreductase [Deinobacterium chartae]MBB6096936.1 putative DsbA family dithiol-disulfide isomerase [Deinobacterium chartae]
MDIEIYADIACPWCYVGEVRLKRALAERPDLPVRLLWRPFQLQPGMPERGQPWPEFVQAKFGSQAEAAFAQVARAGESEGLTFRFDRVRNAPNTRRAHALILGAPAELQAALALRLFRAYFEQGDDVTDPERLCTLAEEVGMNPAAARAALEDPGLLERVDAGNVQAARLGIQGVPFVIFGGTHALSGAQPLEVFLRGLDLAHAAAQSRSG